MSEEPNPPAQEPLEPVTAGADEVAVFKRAIEAIVLVSHDPVPPDLMAQLLEQPSASVERWCDELQAEYAEQGRGFQLARVAGGYRYQTHPDETPYVERFVLNDQRARLSGAALETLAIIAYKQPISRAQVASIRGVDPDGVIRTLAARGYIDEVGRDDGPGQAVLFGTTQLFLEKLGLDSLDNLPPIAEFIPDADVVEALEHGLRVRPEIDEIAPELPADGPVTVTTHNGTHADTIPVAETPTNDPPGIDPVTIDTVEIDTVEIEAVAIEAVEIDTVEIDAEVIEAVEVDVLEADSGPTESTTGIEFDIIDVDTDEFDEPNDQPDADVDDDLDDEPDDDDLESEFDPGDDTNS